MHNSVISLHAEINHEQEDCSDITLDQVVQGFALLAAGLTEKEFKSMEFTDTMDETKEPITVSLPSGAVKVAGSFYPEDNRPPIVIRNVNAERLDEQRQVLASIMLRNNDMTVEEDSACMGILNMLDAWSDDRHEEKDRQNQTNQQ